MSDNLIIDEFVGIDMSEVKPLDKEIDKKLEKDGVVRPDDNTIIVRIKGNRSVGK